MRLSRDLVPFLLEPLNDRTTYGWYCLALLPVAFVVGLGSLYGRRMFSYGPVVSPGLLVGVIGFYYLGIHLMLVGFRQYKLFTLLWGTPVRRIRDAGPGRFEARGTARPIQPEDVLTAPFSRAPCLVCDYQIEVARPQKGPETWETVHSGRRCSPFLLDDGTDRMLIDPATVELTLRVDYDEFFEAGRASDVLGESGLDELSEQMSAGGKDPEEGHRFREYLVRPNERIYVIGTGESYVPAETEPLEGVTLRMPAEGTSGLFYLSDSTDNDHLAAKKHEAIFLPIVGSLLASTSIWALARLMGLI